MLARVLIPSVDQTARRRDLTATTEQAREYARIFEPATSDLARRRILRYRLSITYSSNRGGQLSAVQGFGNRARGANHTFEELGLGRLASMSFRRRSVWIAWLLPEPKVLELPGHSAFNRT